MNSQNPKQTIAFTPLYNIEPSDDILEIDMNGYQILTSDRFFELYQGNADIFQKNKTKFIYAEADANPKYFLVNANIDVILKKHDLTMYDLYSLFAFTLLYFRLYQPGNIQMGSFFVSKKDGSVYRRAPKFDDLCVFQGLHCDNNDYLPDPYVITKDTVAELLKKSTKFESKIKDKMPEIINAAWFFTRAYETSDIAYKIINYFTVLEKLMSDDGDSGDIKFKLGARLSFLMKENLRDFIGKVYNTRSHILHRGDIFTKKSVPELLGYCRELDRICRFVINHFLDKFVDEDKFKIKESYKEIDDSMFELLSKGTNQ